MTPIGAFTHYITLSIVLLKIVILLLWSLTQRSQVTTLSHRLAEPPRLLISLFGPRQTGKTTIVRQALRKIDIESRYLAVDEPESSAQRVPVRCDSRDLPFAPVAKRKLVWCETGKKPGSKRSDLDEDSCSSSTRFRRFPAGRRPSRVCGTPIASETCPLHVVILGSAPLLMQSGLNESLAGRFEPIHVTHWSFKEMSEAFGFDLPTYFYFGGYPGAVPFVRDTDRWRDYVLGTLVEPNIERDLLSMTRVDKPALLKRLFELGAAYSGQIMSYNKMLGQLQDAGNTTTLARYLDLLSSAGLLTGLQKYSNKPYQRKGSSPKLNVLNTALMTAGSGYSFDEAMADRTFRGRIVESAVGGALV